MPRWRAAQRRVSGVARDPRRRARAPDAQGRAPDRGARLSTSPRRSRWKSARTAWRRSAKCRRPPTSSTSTPTISRSTSGFDHALPDDPLPDFRSRNRSVMRPHGVWVVIAPFNFPFALAGGPVAAALVTGNTVVFKSASDTPWSGRMLADCMRDAGLPPGVFNYLNGPGAAVGETLVQHPHTAGITFTGCSTSAWSISAQVGQRPLSAALHRRDGRQECLHRHRQCRPRARRRRHRALRIRPGRAEVFGAVAAVRAKSTSRTR